MCRECEQVFRLPENGKTPNLGASVQFVAQFLQKGQPLGADGAAVGGGFERAAGFGAVAAVVEAALSGQMAQVGEILQQLGAFQMMQAEFLQAGGIDELAAVVQIVKTGVGGGVAAGIERGGNATSSDPKSSRLNAR